MARRTQFEKYLGYKAAAFEVSGYRPREELVYVMYTEVGQQVARFAMRGDRTMFLFMFADEDHNAGEIFDSPKRPCCGTLWGQRMGMPHIWTRSRQPSDLYFDR